MPTRSTAKWHHFNNYTIHFNHVNITRQTIHDNQSRRDTPNTPQIKGISFLQLGIGACLYFQFALPYQVWSVTGSYSRSRLRQVHSVKVSYSDHMYLTSLQLLCLSARLGISLLP